MVNRSELRDSINAIMLDKVSEGAVNLQIGVSTACLYPMETEHALETLGQLGFEAAEIFLNAPSEHTEEFGLRLKEIAQRYQMRIVSIHPYSSAFEPLLFFSGYERRFQDAMKFYESFYRVAQMLGAGIVVLHGDRREGILSEQEYFERYRRLFRHARRCGVLLAQENVERCRSRSSGFIRRMRDYLGDEVRFVLDLKQAIRAGETVEDMLNAMGEQLCHVHLSDHRPAEDCLPPGQGDFDFSQLFDRLNGRAADLFGMIELYRQNYSSLEDLQCSYGYLNGLLRFFHEKET